MDSLGAWQFQLDFSPALMHRLGGRLEIVGRVLAHRHGSKRYLGPFGSRRSGQTCHDCRRVSTTRHVPRGSGNRHVGIRLDDRSCAADAEVALATVVDLAYYSGWRKNEILGLTWEEIDEAGGVIPLSPARSKTLVGRILPISPPIAVAPAEVTRSAEIFPARDSVGQTSGATQRCLNPEFSERIGNSRRTGRQASLGRGGRSKQCPVHVGVGQDGKTIPLLLTFKTQQPLRQELLMRVSFRARPVALATHRLLRNER